MMWCIHSRDRYVYYTLYSSCKMWTEVCSEMIVKSIFKVKVNVYLLVLYGQRPNVQQFYKLI